MHGANATGRPFTGDHAGILLYETLHRFGFSNRPQSTARGDGLQLLDCRITNAVKCLPPGNKPTVAEVKTCNRFLRAELQDLPPGAVIVALGTVAHGAVVKALELKNRDYPFAHGQEHRLPDDRRLLDSYHCSRYNTQTRRLTPRMFEAVFARARNLLEVG
jgi:uracil-DNA glycosylase family 4